jgi:hypothetical protein
VGSTAEPDEEDDPVLVSEFEDQPVVAPTSGSQGLEFRNQWLAHPLRVLWQVAGGELNDGDGDSWREPVEVTPNAR